MRHNHFGLLVVGLFTAILASAARADFKPPKDGKLTESQVTNFIAITKEQYDTIKAVGAAPAGGSGAANMAVLAHANEKMEASITAHGMTKDEYNWVGSQVGKLWPVAMLQKQWEVVTKPDLEKQIKTMQDEAASSRATASAYDKAGKAGQRVLTKEQRTAAVASATSDRDSIAAEVKSDQDAIKPINDEIAQHEKDAADAEALAKNPPATVSADDRNAYIDGKKNEAQAANDAAKDARDRLKEAQKNLDDARARLAVANGKVEHPEVPVTEDEKASVKSENEQAMKEATDKATADDQAVKMLQETLEAGPPGTKLTGKDKPDPDNLALVQKHVTEYLDAIGAGAALKPK